MSSSDSTEMPSSSFQKSFKYDVFLRFWGLDTCQNFFDRLYNALKNKGVCTYKVGENVENGESDNLIKAIEESKFYIIVFSKNYASSPWYLKELVKVMECHKMPGHTAYAVFHDVERTEVRNQSGALKEAADLYQWELELELNTLEGQDKFIEEIVQKILLALYFHCFLVEPLFAVKVDLTPGSAFSFIITCLLAFAGLKSQSVTGFPFKTHPNAIMVPVTSLLIYAFASMAELVFSVAGLDHTSVYAIIARLGRISSLCLLVTSLAILICI